MQEKSEKWDRCEEEESPCIMHVSTVMTFFVMIFIYLVRDIIHNAAFGRICVDVLNLLELYLVLGLLAMKNGKHNKSKFVSMLMQINTYTDRIFKQYKTRMYFIDSFIL